MKKCSKCGEMKSLDLFGVDNSTKDGRMYWCKNCRIVEKREYRRRVKKNNPTQYRRVLKREKVRRDEYMRLWKAWTVEMEYGYCIVCGAPNPEFHHMIPEEKESTVSKFFNRYAPNDENKEIVLIELKKTVPLCNPCHKEIHRRVMAIYGPPTLEKMIRERAR